MAEPDVALDASAPAHGPGAVAPAEDRRLYVASQWRLTWWRFRRHRVAVASGIVVIGFYLVVLGADFLAYADPNASEAQRSLMPPQPIHWFEGWRFRPHVYAVKGVRDPRPSGGSTERIPPRRSRSGSSPKASSIDSSG